MLFDEGFTFRNFLVDAFAIFMFFVLIWLLIAIFSDLFRRHDVSGIIKVCWVIVLIALPYISIFAYILTQSRGMAERSEAQVKQARDNLRQVVGFSVSDEIGKLNRLKAAGTISDQEYGRLRTGSKCGFAMERSPIQHIQPRRESWSGKRRLDSPSTGEPLNGRQRRS